MSDVRRTLLNPLDAVRRRMTKGLEVTAIDPRVRRGAVVRAKVAIEEPDRLGTLEAGLICTEYYECKVSSPMVGTGNPVLTPGPRREMASAVAFEAWQPLELRAGEQEVALAIPAAVPFSYAGQALTYVWEVAVRGDRRGLDAQARHEIVVLP
jgi:hypothetical protein